MKAPFVPQMELDQDEAQLTILDSILGTLRSHRIHHTYTMLSCSDKEKQGQVDGSLNYKYILNISIPLFQHSINLILDSSQASCPIIMFWILINTIINYARDETLSTSTFKLEYNLVVAGCWAALTKSSSVTRPKPTSLMSNDCQCKPPHYLRFKLCTVQDIGLPDDGLGHGGGHFIMKMWRAADISVTSPWHLAPEISDQLVQITASDQLTDIVSPLGRAAHTACGKIHNSPSLHLPLCSFLRSQITVLPSSLVLVSASPPLQ